MLDINGLEFLVPFIVGTQRTIKIQANLETETGEPFRKGEKEQTPFEVASSVGMVGNGFEGTAHLCIPSKVYLHILSKMFGEEMTELDEELASGASEIMNIVYGQAKIILNEKGAGLEKALPSVIFGSDLKTGRESESIVRVVPFKVPDVGVFYLEIYVKEKGEDLNEQK